MLCLNALLVRRSRSNWLDHWCDTGFWIKWISLLWPDPAAGSYGSVWLATMTYKLLPDCAGLARVTDVTTPRLSFPFDTGNGGRKPF